MRAVRLAMYAVTLLVLVPATALAQAAITPLATSPFTLDRGGQKFAGYISIEDELDLFGLWRKGFSPNFDLGVRVGYTDAAGGGVHLGGDVRYALPSAGAGSAVSFAFAGGLQLSFMDLANVVTFPFGVSIGADVGPPDRSVVVYGLPRLYVERIDPDIGQSNTELEIAVELGSEIELTPALDFEANLTFASNDGDHVALALGFGYTR